MIGFGIAGRPRRRWLALGDPAAAAPSRADGWLALDGSSRSPLAAGSSRTPSAGSSPRSAASPGSVYGVMTTAHGGLAERVDRRGAHLDDRLHRCCTASSPSSRSELLPHATSARAPSAVRRTHPTRPTTRRRPTARLRVLRRSDDMELTRSGSSSSPSSGSATSPRGLRLRRRHAAAGARPADDTRAPGPDQHHRAGLGRQRGVAARRGRRDVRRLPRVVRHAVLRLLPAAAAHPGRADRARARPSSTAHKRHERPRGSPAGTARSSGARCCRRSCGAWRSATSSAACRSTPTRSYVGNLLDLLNPYALLGGLMTLTLFLTHGAVFVALKTAGDDPGTGPPRWRPGSAVVAAVAGGRVPGLDAGRHGTAASGSPPSSPLRSRCWARSAPPARARGLGVPRHLRRASAGGGRPLPRRCSRT